MTWRVDVGDCVELMAALEDGSVDAVVTDPPYELGFMGKVWDCSGVAYQVETWEAALRVLKPGGHFLAFGGTRTYHRLACAIEDAGFEIRDTVAWMYGSGFPKSLDVSKAIDKAAGAEREVVGERVTGAAMSRGPSGEDLGTGGTAFGSGQNVVAVTAPATDEARRWDGWGTALKPAHEPIVVARKPLAGTVAANVLEHGTGALNIDGCRVGYDGTPGHAHFDGEVRDSGRSIFGNATKLVPPHEAGRWPANVVLDEEAARALDEQSGTLTSGKEAAGGHVRRADVNRTAYGAWPGDRDPGSSAGALYGDSGGASRFFYCAKASRAERNAGLDGFEERLVTEQDKWATTDRRSGTARQPEEWRARQAANHHPTVKPVSLMRWLVRLVTPPGGLVLDPFTGSGTTGVAAVLEGLRFHGLERDDEYVAIARARLAFWAEHGEDGLRIVAERERAEAAREEILASGQLDLLDGAA